LGFLPTTAPPAVAIALVLIPVFAGALAGWWLHQTLGATRHWWQTALTSVSCGLVAALGLSVLVVWSGGSGGPGRLALVGAAWWPLVGWLALELGVGACAASLLLRLRQGQKNVEGTKHV
ncbi:MAG: DUF6350 family protein, partial [Bifidobacteriaceae bacterium]|jgi:hypothetical protein|nr:DUF6350 family protein [Bifidobacteriaceae bacterium]